MLAPRTRCILMGVIITAIATAVVVVGIILSKGEMTPEDVIESLASGDWRIEYVTQMHSDEFPLEVIVHHMDDDRKMRALRPLNANRRYTVGVLCHDVFLYRIGIDRGPVDGEWPPIPEELETSDRAIKWWNAQADKNELKIRLHWIGWQLNAIKRLQFKERYVALKQQQLEDTQRASDDSQRRAN